MENNELKYETSKQKNKYIKPTIIIGIILMILITIILLITNISKERKTLNNNMEVIKYNYEELSKSVTEYNQIRTDLIEKLNDFTFDTYSNIHNEYTVLLTKYNENIDKIDSYTNNINDKCNVIYKDKNVNNICNNYKAIYEKLINLYVTDLTNYNNKVANYNEYKESNIELFKLIHKDYIDYNNDNLYEGKDE